MIAAPVGGAEGRRGGASGVSAFRQSTSAYFLACAVVLPYQQNAGISTLDKGPSRLSRSQRDELETWTLRYAGEEDCVRTTASVDGT